MSHANHFCKDRQANEHALQHLPLAVFTPRIELSSRLSSKEVHFQTENGHFAFLSLEAYNGIMLFI